MTVGVSDRIAEIIEKMELGDNFETKLRRILEWNLQSRLAEYEMINRRFRQKYQMSLEEFEKNNMLEKLNYSFEVESDYHDWDMAVDGIASLRFLGDRLSEVEDDC